MAPISRLLTCECKHCDSRRVSAGGHQLLRAVPEVREGGGAGGGAEGAVRGTHLPDHPDHLQAALRLLELQAAGQAALDSLQNALT